MKKVYNKHNKHNMHWYIYFILILILAGFVFYFLFFTLLEVKSFDVSFSVANSIGIDLNTTALKFGLVFPGTTSIKNMNISNNYNFPIIVKSRPSKSISDFLVVESPVFIDAGKNKRILVQLIVPENASYGNYSGKIRVEIRK